MRFIDDPLVLFANNQAEQDIRMMKVKMIISGEFRSSYTDSAIALIRSYISTIRKNGVNVIEGIVSAFHNLSLCFRQFKSDPPYINKRQSDFDPSLR